MIKNFIRFNESLDLEGKEKEMHEIHNICNHYGIYFYEINDDMSIDAKTSVFLDSFSINKLPLKFNKARLHFVCTNNNLVSLDGCPNEVNGSFDCSGNELTSLEYSPTKVNGHFACNNNNITSLKGAPTEVGSFFHCNNNKLRSLEGLPKIIGTNIDCSYNYITNFKGIPEDFSGILSCDNNSIHRIYKLFNENSRCIYWINEYDVIQGSNIVMDRLEEVFHQLDMKVPNIKSIEGYYLI